MSWYKKSFYFGTIMKKIKCFMSSKMIAFNFSWHFWQMHLKPWIYGTWNLKKQTPPSLLNMVQLEVFWIYQVGFFSFWAQWNFQDKVLKIISRKRIQAILIYSSIFFSNRSQLWQWWKSNFVAHLHIDDLDVSQCLRIKMSVTIVVGNQHYLFSLSSS